MNTWNAVFVTLAFFGIIGACVWIGELVRAMASKWRPRRRWPRQHHPAYWRDWK